ncbi:MAG: hypothetical protein ABIP43_11375 [Nitrospiraceae bacterium]
MTRVRAPGMLVYMEGTWLLFDEDGDPGVANMHGCGDEHEQHRT